MSEPAFDLKPTTASASPDVQRPTATKIPNPKTRSDSKKIGPLKIYLEVTLDRWQGGYTSRQLESPRFHATRISQAEAIALKLMCCSLNQQGAKLNDGRNVQTNQEALRWVLERLVDQVPEKVLEELAAEVTG